MSRIRALSGHPTSVLLGTVIGAAVGAGSTALWVYVLTPRLPLWASGPIAACCALLAIRALAAVQQRRTARRPRPRRRAHARPAKPRKKVA